MAPSRMQGLGPSVAAVLAAVGKILVDPENRTNGQSDPHDRRPVLHICLTCRPAGTPPEAPNDPAAGSEFHDAVLRRLRDRNLESSVRVNPISCMANCEQGCSAALSAPGKWSYIAGFLGAELADDVIDYALVYGASRTGVVMPSKRAPSLRDAVVARVPAHPDDLPEQRDNT